MSYSAGHAGPTAPRRPAGGAVVETEGVCPSSNAALRLMVQRVEAELNVDAAVGAARDYFERTAREWHEKGPAAAGASNFPEARQSLEVQLGALDAWETYTLTRLKAFKVGRGCRCCGPAQAACAFGLPAPSICKGRMSALSQRRTTLLAGWTKLALSRAD
jgi:hypothetical protein